MNRTRLLIVTQHGGSVPKPMTFPLLPLVAAVRLCLAGSDSRAPNSGVLSARAQASTLFSRAVHAPRGLERLRSFAGHRLTFHSSGQSTAARRFAA
jgi:hypothetical protein